MIRGRKPLLPDQAIIDLFRDGKSDAEIAEFGGVSPLYVRQKRLKLRLLRQVHKPRIARSVTRHEQHTVRANGATIPPINHPALLEGRTIYPTTVVSAVGINNLLVPGINSRKIGSHITKGPAKGWPIFTLTLEERATCPDTCRHWASCYGNNLHLAKRIKHDSDFEKRLAAELAILQFRHPTGFAIRLHVLGDFYSVEYVKMWKGFLRDFKSMLVFGFTARVDNSDPIAQELKCLVKDEWPRFAVRFSNSPDDELSTISIEHPRQKPSDAIICPAQIGKTQSCGSCGLCWHSRKRIAFLQH